jgi:hypothetical protein
MQIMVVDSLAGLPPRLAPPIAASDSEYRGYNAALAENIPFQWTLLRL